MLERQPITMSVDNIKLERTQCCPEDNENRQVK